jgi:hypothetical protein
MKVCSLFLKIAVMESSLRLFSFANVLEYSLKSECDQLRSRQNVVLDYQNLESGPNK